MKLRSLSISQYIITRACIYFYVLLVLIPILLILSLALRLPSEINETFFIFIPKNPTFSNFMKAIKISENLLYVSILRMVVNSAVVTLSSIGLALALSATAGFGFANYRFKGKEFLFVVILLTMMIPMQSYIIPLFFLIKRMHLLKNYLGLIFPYVTIGIPLCVLLFRSFFEGISKEIKDAARIDGASDFYYFLKIVVPLSKPVMATCLIILFMDFWNEFFMALILIQNKKLQTIPLGMSRLIAGRAPLPPPTYAAFLIIAVIPILIVFFIFQRWFIRGIAAGSIKG